jgi:hypothetical protein
MPLLKRELFDDDVMKQILNDNRFAKKDLSRLGNYNKARLTGSTINVSYKYGAGCEELKLGRLFPEEGKGLQSYRFDLRNPLVQKWYWDTDVENCHYIIAKKFCEDYGLKHEKIDEYVSRRDDVLKLVSCIRKKAKTEFLKVLYGGDITLYSPFFEEVEGGVTVEGHAFLTELKREVDVLMDMVWSKHPHLHKLKTGKDKKMIIKKRDPKASLMSLLFQTEERKILMVWDRFLAENGRYMGVYIHDGGLVEKLGEETEFPVDLLNMGSERVREVLGYAAKLTQKEIKHEWSPITPAVSLLKNPFEKVAEEFEKKHLKIINKAYFIKEEVDGFVFMTDQKLKIAYAHLSYDVLVTDKNGKTTVEKKPFITKWTGVEHDIRRKDTVGIYPRMELCPENTFNLWRPFAMSLKKGDYVKNEEALEFFKNHIRILCGNQDEVYDYFIKWLAQMFQYPEVKTTMPTLISKEGSGKGSFLLLLKKIMGEGKVMETPQPSRDVWGSFNSPMVNCFFVNLNELSKTETKQSEGKIKALVTDGQLWINPKGLDQYEIKSYHRWLGSTNKEEPITTREGDRRNLIIRCSDEKKGDIDYFDQFYKYISDETAVRTFYDYLMSIEGMDKFNAIPMPVTEYQDNLKEKNRPVPEQWVEAFAMENHKEGTIELLGSIVYKNFCDWRDTNGYKYEIDCGTLLLRLKNAKIEGIEKGKKTSKGNTTIFDIPKIKKHFNIENLVDVIEPKFVNTFSYIGKA